MMQDAFRIYREHGIGTDDYQKFDECFIGRFDDTEYHEFLWDAFRDIYTLSMYRPKQHRLPSIGSYIDIDKFKRDYEIVGRVVDNTVIEEDGYHYIFSNL